MLKYPFTNFLMLGIIVAFVFNKITGTTPIDVGASYNTVIVQHQCWRHFTSAFYHTGYTHLIFNLVNIYNFGSLLEDKLKSSFVAAVFSVGVIVSTAASILCNHAIVTVGASGGIFSMAGLFLLMLYKNFYRLDSNEKQLYNSIIIFLSTSIFFVIYYNNVDTVAHLVGFVIGILSFFKVWKEVKKARYEQNKQDNA